MKRLSATEAARRFADVLDAVERRRESFVVVRRGREIATISPASPASGKRVKELLRDHQADASWSKELEELRSSLIDQPPAWPD
jgi:prevent-host-death family protein